MYIELDKNTEYIINKLEESGFEAFAVGGCVRDSILGRKVTDYDITTSALPQETKTVFSDHAVIETGIKHGTVAVVLDHIAYEVTTYRTESGYTDSRHPDNVSFVRNLDEDLARRDFTMNAIAYSHKRGIVDTHRGVKDIKSQIIRAVGDAKIRFSEDALRILRALRFSATLGFELERETSFAVHELAPTLQRVSPERVYTELKKLLCGDFALNVIVNYRDALSPIFPISNDITRLYCLPNDFAMRIAYVCKEKSLSALSYLRADNETKRRVDMLLSSSPVPQDIYELKMYISSYGNRKDALDVVSYRHALYNEDSDNIAEKLLDEGRCIFVHELDINGNDLMSMGIEGKEISKAKEYLLSLVLSDLVENKKEALLSYIKQKES